MPNPKVPEAATIGLSKVTPAISTDRLGHSSNITSLLSKLGPSVHTFYNPSCPLYLWHMNKQNILPCHSPFVLPKISGKVHHTFLIFASDLQHGNRSTSPSISLGLSSEMCLIRIWVINPFPRLPSSVEINL